MRFLPFFIVFAVLVSCGDGSSYKPRQFTKVEKELVFADSILRIRALTPVTDTSVWFAANNGKIGFLFGKTPKLATIYYEAYPMEFRSIAKTKDAVFMMTIASPAMLYRIGFNGVEATFIEDVYEEQGEKVFYNAMRFWNDKEGIVMGDPTDDCFSILITRDGGKKWEKLSCDHLPKLAEGEVAFAASNSNIAVYEDHTWLVSGGSQSRVFYSPDKGHSWTVYDTPFMAGGTTAGINAVDFYNEKIGFIVGGDFEHQAHNQSNKAITLDGGKTWSLVSDGSNPGYRSSVRFVPGTKGQELVAVGEQGISFSNNRGKTWRELSREGFYAIEFVNDSVAFASGRGKVVRLVFRE